MGNIQAIRKWRSPDETTADAKHVSLQNEPTETITTDYPPSNEGDQSDNSIIDDDFDGEGDWGTPEADRLQELDVLSEPDEIYEHDEISVWEEENEAPIMDNNSIMNEEFSQDVTPNSSAVENSVKMEHDVINTDNSVMNNAFYEPNIAEAENCLQMEAANQVPHTGKWRAFDQGVNYSEQISGLQNIHENNEDGNEDREPDSLRQPELFFHRNTLARSISQNHLAEMQIEIDRLKEENTNLFIENINLKEVQLFMDKELSRSAASQSQLKRELNQKRGHLERIICDLRKKIKVLQGENLNNCAAAIVLQRKLEEAMKNGRLNGAVGSVVRGQVMGEQRKPVKRLQHSRPQVNPNSQNKIWCKQNLH